MKLFKSILLTFLCAVAILIIGYMGIVIGGKQILKVSSEPERVTMKGDISSLFYSKIEDDIQLYPWNYYPKEQGDTSNQQAANIEMNGGTGPFAEYSLSLENNVFYTLIAMAADVETQEVSKWYGDQEKTIMMNMVQGQSENEPIDIYFYDEVIRLNGKPYRVEISCNGWSMISFSCIQQREEDVRETKEWKEQKELLAGWMEDNQEEMAWIYDCMYSMSYNYKGDRKDFSRYVDLSQYYLEEIHDAIVSEEEKKENEQLANSGELIISSDSYDQNSTGLQIQMIELKDSLLLVMESDITLGIYYDVLRQKVTGFHFF